MNSEWDFQSIDALGASFQKARIILSAAELDIFSKFQKGSKTVDQIVEDNKWCARGVQILLDALVAMGFVKKNADVYSIDPDVLRLLDSKSPDTILPMLLHRVRMWNSWSNLTDIVSGKLDIDSFVKVRKSDEDMKAFIGAMEVIGRQRANELAREVHLEGRKSLLDVGGGSGVYSRAFLEFNPNLSVAIFDLPVVIGMTRKKFEDSGLTDRASFIAGDFNSDMLPARHDVALLSAIIHINSREKNRSLFSKIHSVLEPGGIIIIRDYIMDDSRTRPEGGAIFAVNMLVATSGGNTYTFKEIYEDLKIAGFVDVRLVREGLRMDQLVTGMA
jgi:ubiquinone/menaquinone biosynthesis C-methylase UbiE